MNNLTKLQVKYNNTFINGNKLSINQTKNKPDIIYNYLPNSYYTIIIYDIDAPSRNNPIYKNWIHWIVGNITYNNSGNILFPYEGPNPPIKSGLHRYIILLLQQPNKINYKIQNKRNNFNVKKFINEYNLIPLSINYYNVERN